jgi:hypothetical protein
VSEFGECEESDNPAKLGASVKSGCKPPEISDRTLCRWWLKYGR